MIFFKITRYILITFFTFFLLFLLYDFLYPLDYKRIFKPLSTLIYNKNGELIRIKLSLDGYNRFKVNLNEIPILLQKSVLNFEDRYFYQHFGVNFIAVIKALFHNMKSNRKIGASTISMQVARMMKHKKRTFYNKFIEMINAFQLEWHHSKDEILTMYFNLAPYGGNIDGIKAAARFYYNKPLKSLSIAQMAILTTIPKNPNKNRLDIAKNLYEKRLKVLRILLKEKLINLDQFNRAFREPIIKKRFRAPFIAPHFTSHLNKKGVIYSSLDQDIQNQLLKILQIYVKKFENFNLHNAAGIIIDNKSMKIVAYVGSDRFFNTKNFGQNNGVTMIRSPGSSLKPFIYAKALDNGLITPKQKLFDLPLHIHGYDPKNFNKTFVGEVAAEIALQNSLNIPAIKLNKELKEDSLYELLIKSNIKSLNKNKIYYGDSIALGGFGISLFDLAHLYTAFANKGELKSLGFTKDHKSILLSRLFSKEAAFITNEILSDAIRAEFSSFWESSTSMVRVAFKTGTSANSKDLYSIGVTPKYTVAIWMGNFNSTATKNLTGINSASRVLFELFSFLSHNEKMEWFKQPKKVIKKNICTDAIILGRCKSLQEDYIIKDVKRKRSCKFLTAEVLAFLKEQKAISKDDMIKHPCYEKWMNYPPLISSLYDKQTIIKSSLNKDAFQEVMLKCYTFGHNQTITWLVDDKPPFKALSKQELFYKLSIGKHIIICLDDQSLVSKIAITIKEE